MKKCPFCAEEIQDEAIYCRFCRQFLEQKKKVPFFLRPAGLLIAVLCVGPLAIPLFWMQPNSSLFRKLFWTVGLLLLTWALCVLMKWSIQSLFESLELLKEMV